MGFSTRSKIVLGFAIVTGVAMVGVAGWAALSGKLTSFGSEQGAVATSAIEGAGWNQGTHNNTCNVNGALALCSSPTTSPTTNSNVATASQKLRVSTWPNCKALTPSGWSASVSPFGDAIDIFGPSRQAYAGWGIKPIQPAMNIGGLYPEHSADPSVSNKWLAEQIISSQLYDRTSVTYTSAERNVPGTMVSVNGAENWLKARDFETQKFRGIVYYRIIPTVLSSQNDYIKSVYYGIASKTSWATDGPLAANIAASIRCTTQTRPSSVGSSSSDKADGLSNSTYNKELDTEYYHDPNTGENYLFGNASSISGDVVKPDGTVLVPGRSDY